MPVKTCTSKSTSWPGNAVGLCPERRQHGKKFHPGLSPLPGPGSPRPTPGSPRPRPGCGGQWTPPRRPTCWCLCVTGSAGASPPTLYQILLTVQRGRGVPSRDVPRRAGNTGSLQRTCSPRGSPPTSQQPERDTGPATQMLWRTRGLRERVAQDSCCGHFKVLGGGGARAS